jgi:Protein of unknown function (DUF1592)/Protein of unknown function (DUF1588)/Protein of unknown function (DUF1595)/Protein of unknown function (DUF1585)/Protein of unknown function (DUF1587)
MKTVPYPSRTYAAFTALSLISLCSLACTGEVGSGRPGGATGGAASTGGSGNGGAGVGGTGVVDLSKGGPKLRVLTQLEYKNSLTDLFGAITAKLDLPADTFLAGFTSIGGAEVAINASAVEPYETASLAAVGEVFADAARWQKLVGCQPKADLSDACVTTFIQTFGKRAFRRDLTDAEVQQWLKIGKDAAQLPGSSAAQGLATLVSGLLQSPFFLYRIETNKLDAVSGRLKYDGGSMATRLAFLLTGHPPSNALLAAAAAGQLDTADGVKTAAAPLLTDPNAVDRMTAFFSEYSQASLVLGAQKSAGLFPTYNAALQSSMFQATELFLKNIVLAPGADVRTLFDSDQTFVDANLAPIYGVAAPASGFMQIKLDASAARAGLFGQAGVLAGHSQPDRNSPTRRGVFLLETFLCLTPPPPPDGVKTDLATDPTQTRRAQLEAHRKDPVCAGCHALFDPLGMGLEHLDSIGKYRATENGIAIDATGSLDSVNFDGALQLGAAFRQNARAMTCMMSNFYRSANGRKDATADSAEVDKLTQTLTAKGFVWRDLVAEFIASDAFRSAPAAAVTAGNQ